MCVAFFDDILMCVCHQQLLSLTMGVRTHTSRVHTHPPPRAQHVLFYGGRQTHPSSRKTNPAFSHSPGRIGALPAAPTCLCRHWPPARWAAEMGRNGLSGVSPAKEKHTLHTHWVCVCDLRQPITPPTRSPLLPLHHSQSRTGSYRLSLRISSSGRLPLGAVTSKYWSSSMALPRGIQSWPATYIQSS